MLEASQIIQLKSRNVSMDEKHTRTVVNQIWNSASIELKKKAVELGSYPNTKSFHPVKMNGRISVRMTVVLAIVFNINPFYIIGDTYTEKEFSESLLVDFLEKYGFSHVLQSNALAPIVLPKNSDATMSEPIDVATVSLCEDEIVALIRAIFIKARLGDKNSIEQIKTISKILI